MMSGSGIGPWCSYFVSWAAKNAGAPLGEAGQGFGSVSAVASWAPAVSFSFLLLTLAFRPAGLLGR